MVSKEFLDLKNIRTQYLGPHKGGRNTHGILLKKGLYKLSGPFSPKVRIRLYSTSVNIPLFWTYPATENHHTICRWISLLEISLPTLGQSLHNGLHFAKRHYRKA